MLCSRACSSPSLRGFRYGRVEGWCRVFTLVSIVNVRRGLARGRRLATATARRRPGAALHVCLYEIDVEDLPELVAREARLRLTLARYTAERGSNVGGDATGEALLCSEYSDAEYFAERCAGRHETYEAAVGRYYAGALYRDDLLPVPAYTMRCLRAHERAGRRALANLLDESFLGDGVTTLRQHLHSELDDAREGRRDGGSAEEPGWPLAELRKILLRAPRAASDLDLIADHGANP